MKTVQETPVFKVNGFVMLLVGLGLLGAAVWSIVQAILGRNVSFPGPLWYAIALAVVGLLTLAGLFTVQPNEARVLVFFGKYTGSCRDSGFQWANPFATKKHVSLRVRNFNSQKVKVNDQGGNPIEIAAVVVWRVIDSARALFDVDHYEEFVSIQSETAIRGLASRYPYDSHDEGVASLRGTPEEIANTLKDEVTERLTIAGVEVMEARLSHLAYAPEIAQAMLRRQQAQAIIAARQQIVEGAVGMVQMALHKLSEEKIVDLDEEKKATMVNNLLVVLTSEQESQPVLNAGTLYG